MDVSTKMKPFFLRISAQTLPTFVELVWQVHIYQYGKVCLRGTEYSYLLLFGLSYHSLAIIVHYRQPPCNRGRIKTPIYR